MDNTTTTPSPPDPADYPYPDRPADLLVVRPDGTTYRTYDTYDHLRLAVGNWIEHVNGRVRHIEAYVDEEGMLRGAAFNPVASMALGRAVWGPAVLLRFAAEITNNPLDGDHLAFVEGMAEIWRAIHDDAVRLGQTVEPPADGDRMELAPRLIPMPDGWMPGDPWPENLR